MAEEAAATDIEAMRCEGAEIARKLSKVNAERAAIVNGAREFALSAHAAGMTEVELAALLGVDRARTIRRWLGKMR